MRKIDKIRLISHNLGAVLVSIGLYLLFLSLISEPTLLFDPVQEILYSIYLILCPVLIVLVILEDVILLGRCRNAS